MPNSASNNLNAQHSPRWVPVSNGFPSFVEYAHSRRASAITQQGRVRSHGGIRVLCALIAVLVVGWPLFAILSYDHTTNNSLLNTNNLRNYFSNYKGFTECKIHVSDLYTAPDEDQLGFHKPDTFCHDRKRLLEALSGGGRIGFDAPYQSRGCSYRWFTVEEICFILERFDSIVFIGDETLQTIYSGLNILLRQDLAYGALNLASMDDNLQNECRCNNQYTKQACHQHYLLDSERANQDDHTGSAYFCNRIKHAFLRTDGAQLSRVTVDKFKQLVPRAPKSNYHPVPIIHALSPASASLADAGNSLKKIVDLADESERNTPILWIGPTAAGHIELKGRKGNQEIWQFDRDMAELAKEHDVEVIGMWNLTTQATSWDGMRFGEGVAITQAMMILNWLSRLESS